VEGELPIRVEDGRVRRQPDHRGGGTAQRPPAQAGSALTTALLRTDIFHLRSKYYDLGYLGVLIADSTRTTGRKVDIVFTIDPGEALSVGHITIEGNKLVRRRVIEAEIEVKSGDVCRFEKVVKTQRNLFETGLFNVVDVLPENIDPVRKTVDIRIRVRERKESWIETGFGGGNVLGSRIFAEWGTRNLLGYGRTLRFKVQYAFDIFEGEEIDFDKLQFVNNYYRYDAIYQQRRVFGLKLGAGVNAFIEDDETVPDLDVYTRGTTFGVAHQFGRRVPTWLLQRAHGQLPRSRTSRAINSQPRKVAPEHPDVAEPRHARFYLLVRSGEYRLVNGQRRGRNPGRK
jgi:outer membrane protein assembly factor BamA